jgi:Ca-activated chloride channel family protein
LDEETLQRVAEMTEGEYYLAESSEELLDVFSNLQTRTEKTKVETEVSGLFAAAGALLALAGIALSLRWSPLP